MSANRNTCPFPFLSETLTLFRTFIERCEGKGRSPSPSAGKPYLDITRSWISVTIGKTCCMTLIMSLPAASLARDKRWALAVSFKAVRISVQAAAKQSKRIRVRTGQWIGLLGHHLVRSVDSKSQAEYGEQRQLQSLQDSQQPPNVYL